MYKKRLIYSPILKEGDLVYYNQNGHYVNYPTKVCSSPVGYVISSVENKKEYYIQRYNLPR